MKAVVFTLGCKVNTCESDNLISGLKSKGYEVYNELVYADLYIINTCAVTLEAEKKSRQAIARVKKLNSNAKIIVTGCASQNNPQAFIEKENVTIVSGTGQKQKILDMLDDYGVKLFDNKEFDSLDFPPYKIDTRAFVKVQDGCDNFCSYCLIPYLRGRSRSRSVESIIDEINNVDAKEIVLTAINLSTYNYNGIDLTGLIKRLASVNKRIRLGSIEEGVINEEFLLSLKNLKNFAEHFHLSMQSGSTNVLKKMNRKYSSEEYLKTVNLIYKYFPNCAITTDIIVGFPTETEEDFIETYNFSKICNFADIHCFIYSKRTGTVASKLKDLPYEVKKYRQDRLLELKRQLHTNFLTKNLNLKMEVIFEEFDGEYTTGYTSNYIKVYVLGNYEKMVKNVTLNKIFKDGVMGIII